MPAAIDVIVVNFNGGEALLRSLRALQAQEPAIDVTVVDNASSDGSATRADAEFGGRPGFRLLRNPDNPGFAAAINRVVRGSGTAEGEEDGGLLLLLNPDCELHPGALSLLAEAITADPGAALAAPRVIDRSGRVMRGTLRRFPDPWKSLMTFSGLWRLGGRWPAFRGVERSGDLPAGVTLAEAVSGACMLLRKDAFFDIGGMDSDYRLHCEDLDLMYRLHLSGRHCLLVPGAVAVHDQGTSSSSRPLWVHWQKHRGMQRFFDKFQAADRAPPVRWAVRTGIWLRWLLTVPRPLWQAARRALRGA